ncbi:MAG: iron-sulfur cluster assembly scaffold protein [Alphaproteobacteria bacterium HGW-Alphaproteobacteria-16]|nr:MAG: iron-sulfur cluster assembly scaffold protein [Alphaproteobacteria bacterium HGW-Alphaproteobacteria-16]
MNAPLYNTQILRLAASIPFHTRLDAPMASVERRSPVCGSRVAVDVDLDSEGRVAALGMKVNACALGQASASLMGGHAIGRSLAELSEARDALTAWLAGERATPPDDWPGLEIFAPALPHSARHPSIRLAFEAVAEAAEIAARAPAGQGNERTSANGS